MSRWKFIPKKVVHHCDDPEADATDFAHPAYWRGEDMGVFGATRRILEALAFGKQGGVTASPELNKARELVEECRELVYQAADALQWCSVSSDFALGGQARIGWTTVIEPVLRRYYLLDINLNKLQGELKEARSYAYKIMDPLNVPIRRLRTVNLRGVHCKWSAVRDRGSAPLVVLNPGCNGV